MNVALWSLAALAVVFCEVVGRAADHGWPTAVGLFRAARGRVVGRVGLVLAWLWLGWHVFAR